MKNVYLRGKMLFRMIPFSQQHPSPQELMAAISQSPPLPVSSLAPQPQHHDLTP